MNSVKEILQDCVRRKVFDQANEMVYRNPVFEHVYSPVTNQQIWLQVRYQVTIQK